MKFACTIVLHTNQPALAFVWQSLLVFDNAHSLLELGKRVFTTDISVAMTEAAIGNLEVLRARIMVLREAAAEHTSDSGSGSGSGSGGGGGPFVLKQEEFLPVGDGTTPTPGDGSSVLSWWKERENAFPGPIRRAEHFWDFLVSCLNFVRTRVEVGT